LRTIRDLHRAAASVLTGSETPALDAKLLLLRAARLTEETFLIRPEAVLRGPAVRRFRRLVARRRRGEPLAYLTGRREFWSLSLVVRPGVLIPRPETELVVETVLALSERPDETIADVGTGCGAIALALAAERPGARIIAVDASRRALRTARGNARRLGLSNVEFRRGDLYAPLADLAPGQSCDFIASNPPYLARSDWDALSPEIREHEPRRALLAGPTGLEVIERIVRDAPAFLKPGGYLVIEIGAGQAARARELFGPDWAKVDVRSDLAGIPRVLSARKK
jgi:release factor glutamine methyltransferase